MSTIERSIDVHVPVRTAYDQWTQFESFPQFMEGVENIEQVTDTLTHWRTRIAGVHREFDAEITEQRPDERVAWQSVKGEQQAGVVTFHRLDPENTRIMLQLDFHPQGFVEKAGDALGIVSRQVSSDLERFKQFIEARGEQTGGWRGEVPRSPQRGETATDTTSRSTGAPSASYDSSSSYGASTPYGASTTHGSMAYEPTTYESSTYEASTYDDPSYDEPSYESSTAYDRPTSRGGGPSGTPSEAPASPTTPAHRTPGEPVEDPNAAAHGIPPMPAPGTDAARVDTDQPRPSGDTGPRP